MSLPFSQSSSWCRSPQVARYRAADWLTSQSTSKGILKSMEFFLYDGHKLAYTVHGEGPRTTILMPGLLLSQKMQTPLATDLAAHGNRVVTLDFLGHGASDRPAGDVALLDRRVRAPGARPARPSRARAGGRRRNLARSQRHARARRDGARARCAGWSSRCPCSTTRSPPARPRSRRCCSRSRSASRR